MVPLDCAKAPDNGPPLKYSRLILVSRTSRLDSDWNIFSVWQGNSYCFSHEYEGYSYIYSIRSANILIAAAMVRNANVWIKIIFKRKRLGRCKQATIQMVCMKYLHYT